jgi:hypothetical protein
MHSTNLYSWHNHIQHHSTLSLHTKISRGRHNRGGSSGSLRVGLSWNQQTRTSPFIVLINDMEISWMQCKENRQTNTISSASTLSWRTPIPEKTSGTKIEQVIIKCIGTSELDTYSSDISSTLSEKIQLLPQIRAHPGSQPGLFSQRSSGLHRAME